MFNIFKKAHKHDWTKECRMNKKHHMIYYLRKCSCGVTEIQHSGFTGDKKWHLLSDGFKFDWEKKWFEESELTILCPEIISP